MVSFISLPITYLLRVFPFYIKLDVSIKIKCHLESILVFSGMYLIMNIIYLRYPDELLIILDGELFPPTLGNVEDPIVSCL